MKKRLILLRYSLAIACIGMAFFILGVVGLPERALYIGYNIPELGYVAPETGSIAPPFTAQTLNGNPFNSQAQTGTTLVINFWATWCVPCLVEMPELQELHEEHGESITVIGINLGEPTATIRQWQQELGLTFTLLVDDNNAIARLYQLRGQPTTVVVMPNGRIQHIFYGATTANAILNTLTTP